MKKIKLCALSILPLLSVMHVASTYAQVDSHTVEINGNVVANTCELFETSTANLTLPDVSLIDLTEVGANSEKTAYVLGLQNCVPGSTGDMTISYESHESIPVIQNKGSAEGVGLALFDNQDKTFVPGDKIEFTVDDNGQYENTLNVAYQKTDENTTMGSVLGSVTFQFNYI